uniref:DUF38 domain-containing protein n=1 Tax=Panagrolaimus davidi TaxID=227884 RepID=A0A914QYR9_9BILA
MMPANKPSLITMILPLEFYNKCDPSYKKVIDQLEMKLARIDIYHYDLDAVKVGKIISTISEFSRMYLTPKEYWEYCLEMNDKVVRGSEKWSERCYKIVNRAFTHMCYEDKYFVKPYGYEDLKLLWFSGLNEFGDVYERDFEYPHLYIDKCFRDFELRTTRLPSAKLVKRYKEMKALYPKIKAAEGDDDKWFKLLLETNDDAFVKDNVENCLGNNLLNVELWKLYMDNLKQSCQYKCLLKLYSKYCRFFLDDTEMKKEYKEAMLKYENINIQWDNLLEFEVTNGVEEDNKEGDIDLESVEDESMDGENDVTGVEMKKVLPLDKKLCAAYYDTYQNQYFAFHESIIRYILENANHQVLRKLFSSCKHFYFKKQTPICYRLQVHFEETYKNESLFLHHSSNQDLFVKKMFITGSIKVAKTKQHDKTFMANLIPRLSQCHAKYIHLDYQNLTSNELEFLIGHGGVVEINVTGCQIKDGNNDYVHLEEITKFLPNIEKLGLSYVKTHANTAKALLAQKFNGKIFEIYIQKIFGEPFDANKNDKDEYDFDLFLTFNKENFSLAYVNEFKEIMSGLKIFIIEIN